MKILLLNNFGFFISKLSILSYTSFLSILIGIFYGPYTLGVYSIADKIRGAMQAFLIPISQVMLPEITNQVRLRNFNYIYKSIKLSLIFSLLTALLIYMVFSFFIIDILTFLNAEISQQQIFLCKILGLIIFPVTISNWAGKQILIPFGHSKYFNNILLSISVFTMLMIIPIISNFDVEYVSLLYLGSEMLVGIAMTFIIYFRRVLHNEQ
jgi:O-antigen/teichoic acid export membrane protein